MPYFLVLISYVRTSQAYAYACAYRTSGNQALMCTLLPVCLKIVQQIYHKANFNEYGG